MKKNTLIISIISGIVILSTVSLWYIAEQGKKKNPQTQPNNQVQQPNSNKTSTPAAAETIPTISNIKPSAVGKWGNTPGNLALGGKFAAQGNYLYFDYNQVTALSPSFADRVNPISLCRTMPDGITGLTALPSNYPSFINIVGDWVYFTGTGGLYRVKVTGQNYGMITTGNISQLIAYDNNLYYRNDFALVKAPADDPANDTVLFKNVLNYTITQDGKTIIYNSYNSLTDMVDIYRANIDGSSQKKLIQLTQNQAISDMMSYNNYVYFMGYDVQSNLGEQEYTSNGNAYGLSIMRFDYTKDNPKIETFVETANMNSININGNYLYYMSKPYIDSLELHRINLDNNSKETFNITGTDSFNPFGFYILDDKVYFLTTGINQDIGLCIYDIKTNTLRLNGMPKNRL